MIAERIAPGTLYSQVLDAIGMAIVKRQEPFDEDCTTIEVLEASYPASRSVIRECVRVLEAMGMVRVRRRVGLEVLRASEWDLFNARLIHWRLASSSRDAQLRALVELRHAVEPEAARLAAARISVRDAGDLIGTAARVWSAGTAGDMDDFIANDMRFHRLLLGASRNEMFDHLSPLMEELISGRAEYGLMPREHSGRALQLHVDAANAIQSGDAQRAGAAVLEIIDIIQVELRHLWDGAAPGGETSPIAPTSESERSERLGV